MTEKRFFDTNILIYSHFRQSDDKSRVAKEIISLGGCISTQVIIESSDVLIKKANYSEKEISDFITRCYKHFNVIPYSEQILFKASNLRETNQFSYWDSLIVASALDCKCTILYTEDMQDGLIIENLRICNPFK